MLQLRSLAAGGPRLRRVLQRDCLLQAGLAVLPPMLPPWRGGGRPTVAILARRWAQCSVQCVRMPAA